jgi:hypothetical protein
VVNLRVEVRKVLWGNAGNQCAFPECTQRIIGDLAKPGQAFSSTGGVIGEEAHIRSSKPTGPRHETEFPPEKLNDCENLILLCPTHHTVIDKNDGRAWPVAEVTKMKEAHEARVDAAMNSAEKDRNRLEVALAARIDRWEVTLNVAGWEELTRCLNSHLPYVSNAQWLSLTETASWLAGVHWPPRYPKLAAAFKTHEAVLDVLIRLLTDSFVLAGDHHSIRRRHKETWFSGSDGEQKYAEAISQFGVDDAVAGVLITELTRSVNLVMTAINDELLPLYRFNDGSVQMIEGDIFWGLWSSHPKFEPLIWESFPRAYALSDISSRVRAELQGGDPRNGIALAARSFDPSLPADATDGADD